MSNSLPRDSEAWEYRHLLIAPHNVENDQSEFKYGDPGFSERLVELIEDLDSARAAGWKLLSVKLEDSDDGSCRLNAHLKRRKPAAGSPSGEPHDLPDVIRAKFLDGESRPLDTDRAA